MYPQGMARKERVWETATVQDLDLTKYIMWLNQSVLTYPRYNPIMMNQGKKSCKKIDFCYKRMN